MTHSLRWCFCFVLSVILAPDCAGIASAAARQCIVEVSAGERDYTAVPVIINEYHYGGMGLRGAREWFGQPGSDFLTSLGKTRADGNHTRTRWVITHGRSDGGPAAVVAMGHPDNFRAPQPVRLHPDKPYFCFAPMVLGPFEIAPGRPYVWHYRFATCDGTADAVLADRLWRDYVETPAVRIVSE